MIVSELDSIRDGGDFFSAILERMIEDSAVDLISGIELTISLRDIVIFEDLMIKKGSLLPPYNSRRVNEVVEFLISLEAVEIRILPLQCSTRQKNNSIIRSAIASFYPFKNEIIYPS